MNGGGRDEERKQVRRGQNEGMLGSVDRGRERERLYNNSDSML